MRQQDILTRLLESEKAERKQEQDNKREAEQAKRKRKKPTYTPLLINTLNKRTWKQS
jgi:hypothetical protein